MVTKPKANQVEIINKIEELLASVRHEVTLVRDDIEKCHQELKEMRDQLMKAGIPNLWP